MSSQLNMSATYCLQNNDLRIEVSPIGAALLKIESRDRNGNFGDVLRGIKDPKRHAETVSYFGACLGRFANRLGDAVFEVDGQVKKVNANDGKNLLHGGSEGFHRGNFLLNPVDEYTLRCVLCSEGESGFPGTVFLELLYILDGPELVLRYLAKVSEPTVLNLSNHCYFNLNPQSADILSQRIQITAEHYLPVTPECLPTGELKAVEGTAFDLRQFKQLQVPILSSDSQILQAGGLDHCFCLSNPDPDSPKAIVEDDASGRRLTLYTDMPGLQIYSCNSDQEKGLLPGEEKKHFAFCLEPEYYPDFPHQPHFPQMLLRPDELYAHEIRFHFSTFK